MRSSACAYGFSSRSSVKWWAYRYHCADNGQRWSLFCCILCRNIPQTEYKLLQMSTMHTNTVWNMKKQWNISNVHDTQWTDGTSSVVCIIRITVFFTTHHNLFHIALLKLELTLQIWHPKPLLLNPCKFNVLHYVQCTLYMYTCFPYYIILKRIFTGLSRFEAIIIMDLRDFNYLLML